MEPPGDLAQNKVMITIALTVGAGIFLFLIRRYRASVQSMRMNRDYEIALELLDQMIRRDPTNAMAFWQKGEVYEAMDMPQRALQYYSVAHRMCPRAYAYHHYSEAYDRLKENLKAKSPLSLQPLN